MSEGSESILRELMAENSSLREKLKNTIQEEGNTTLETLSSTEFSEEENALRIKGVLFAPGFWNGKLYPKEEVQKLYQRYKGKLEDLRNKAEHERDPEFGKEVLGKNTEVHWDEQNELIRYTALIDDPKACDDIKSGKFKSTSMKFKQRNLIENGMKVARDLEPIDNSLVENPACTACNITSWEELSKNSASIFMILNEDTIKESLKEKNERSENSMSIQTPQTFEVKETTALVFPNSWIEEQEIELEAIPFTKAMEDKRIIFKVLDPGIHELQKKKVKRKATYDYPEPADEKYKDYYGKKKKKEELEAMFGADKAKALIDLVGEELAFEFLKCKGKKPGEYYEEEESENAEHPFVTIFTLAGNDKNYKIVKNKASGKFMLMKRTGKKGFGAWKFVKTFDDEESAKKFATEELKKQSFKCPACDEEFEDTKELIKHWNKEHSEEYGKYEEMAKKIKCPVCSTEFDEKDFAKHWKDEHEKEYGAYDEKEDYKKKKEGLSATQNTSPPPSPPPANPPANPPTNPPANPPPASNPPPVDQNTQGGTQSGQTGTQTDQQTTQGGTQGSTDTGNPPPPVKSLEERIKEITKVEDAADILILTEKRRKK